MNTIKEALEKAKKAEFYNQRILLIDQALAALEKDGYVLVPVEPTEEMRRAWEKATYCIFSKKGYQAAIKAAQEG